MKITSISSADNEACTASKFVPMPWLKNPHLMTIAPSFVPRGFGLKRRQVERVFFPVAPGSQIVGMAHFQPDRASCPTFILVHGLEGSSESFYIAGLAEKALQAGANVVRLNLRNCGGTLHLTPTLYNAGLSTDILRVVESLVAERGLHDLFLVGYSLGGNLVLKASAELGRLSEHVSGTVAISPPIDLEACVQALEQASNRIYELRFLSSLKRKIQAKDRLYPNSFPVAKLAAIKSVRAFDDTFTAPDGQYGTAAQYYQAASSRPLLGLINVPTLIIAAQDDPLVPFVVFKDIETVSVRLLGPEHGGHAGFIQDLRRRHIPLTNGATRRLRDGLANRLANVPQKDHFWADEQILDFCLRQSKLMNERS